MGVYFQKEDITSLNNAVQSILSQDFSDFEFLICDDGSVKSASDLLDRLAENDSRIRLIRPGKCYTLPQKLNLLFQKSSGAFIARMDDDDISYPNRFSQQLHYLIAHPEIAFAGCNVDFVSATGKKTEHTFPEFPLPKDFRFSMPFIHPALLFRREALEKANGYSEDPSCLLNEDYDLLLRLYALGMSGANVQNRLFAYSMAGVELRHKRYRYRMNEAKVRYRRFRDLGMLPASFPYVVKPLLIGLLPLSLVNRLRNARNKQEGKKC